MVQAKAVVTGKVMLGGFDAMDEDDDDLVDEDDLLDMAPAVVVRDLLVHPSRPGSQLECIFHRSRRDVHEITPPHSRRRMSLDT